MYPGNYYYITLYYIILFIVIILSYIMASLKFAINIIYVPYCKLFG